VVLHPLTVSRTDLAQNPNPLVVVWAGPIIGVLLPLLVWIIVANLRWRGAYLVRFFAGFCLIANGVYIAFGSIDGVGDCGEMLRHGSPPWLLWAFGAVTVPAGLWLWHRQGQYFGLGTARGQVDQNAAYGCLLLALGLLLVGFLVGGE
jgi:hypothetical protein